MQSSKMHRCSLKLTVSNGLPKLAPNASSFERLCRRFREQMILNPNILRCRKFFRNKSSIVAEQKRHSGGPHFYIIHPYSNFSAMVQIVFFLTWLYRMLELPMRFHSAIEKKKTADFDRYVMVPTQWTVIILMFFTGYENTKERRIEIEPKKIWMRYLKTYLVPDILAVGYIILIMDEIVIPLLTHREFHYMWFAPTRIIRNFCFYIRIHTVLDFLNAICYLFKFPREIRRLCIHIVRTGLILHLFCCLLYFVPMIVYYDKWPSTSWIVQAKINPGTNHTFSEKYFKCSLLTMSYFFGASHGSYQIVEPLDMICLSLITFFGRLYTLYVLADTLWLFGITSVSESNYERFKSQLEAYMESKDLPLYLKKRLCKYYEFKLQKHYFNETQILNTLSDHLKLELFVFGIRRLMQKSDIFKHLPKSSLALVMANLRNVAFSPGDIIIRIGRPPDNVYFISSGTIAVINDEDIELCHLTDGDSFGIITLTSAGVQKYQFIAVESSEVYYADKNFIKTFMTTNEEMASVFKLHIKKKSDYFNKLDDEAKRGGTTVISLLNRRRLLEMPIKRPTFTEH